ncbi:MAG: motility associated factor glycosyltransferase family protein [Treponema sp.]|nr:motility associated factor glycosyltransferase family protein [Treponema sp.]
MVKEMEGYFYSKIEQAKDGNLIPICQNSSGQEIFMHSKYNPIREAEGFVRDIDEGCLFFIVLGLAGGYHIQKLLEKCPEAKILVADISQSALDFLSAIPCVKKLMSDKRVLISDEKKAGQKILSSYKPALHGNLTILSLRQWENIFTESCANLQKEINSAIKLLAQDFSVQSHFGKIWQKNILTNLSLAEKTLNFSQVKKEIKEKSLTEKTAAIIAAGPSLDNDIKKLRDLREKYFIIATDTAFSALRKVKIDSDAVVSIDGQQVSHEHYMDSISKKTLYVFDLCANSSAVRKAILSSKNVLLSETGHPLSQYASLYTGKRSFPHLEAGSGTVTIAAASLARNLGFTKIEFFGSDFSYIKGRAYARGTYLEGNFHSKSNRLSPAEKSYDAIMYRTPLIKLSEDRMTTEILQAYKESLESFMKSKNNDFCENEEYGRFDLKDFKSWYCKELKSAFRSEKDFDENSFATTTLLPLCAKLGKGSAFLAYLKTLSYTERV